MLSCLQNKKAATSEDEWPVLSKILRYHQKRLPGSVPLQSINSFITNRTPRIELFPFHYHRRVWFEVSVLGSVLGESFCVYGSFYRSLYCWRNQTASHLPTRQSTRLLSEMLAPILGLRRKLCQFSSYCYEQLMRTA